MDIACYSFDMGFMFKYWRRSGLTQGLAFGLCLSLISPPSFSYPKKPKPIVSNWLKQRSQPLDQVKMVFIENVEKISQHVGGHLALDQLEFLFAVWVLGFVKELQKNKHADLEAAVTKSLQTSLSQDFLASLGVFLGVSMGTAHGFEKALTHLDLSRKLTSQLMRAASSSAFGLGLAAQNIYLDYAHIRHHKKMLLTPEYLHHSFKYVQRDFDLQTQLQVQNKPFTFGTFSIWESMFESTENNVQQNIPKIDLSNWNADYNPHDVLMGVHTSDTFFSDVTRIKLKLQVMNPTDRLKKTLKKFSLTDTLVSMAAIYVASTLSRPVAIPVVNKLVMLSIAGAIQGVYHEARYGVHTEKDVEKEKQKMLTDYAYALSHVLQARKDISIKTPLTRTDLKQMEKAIEEDEYFWFNFISKQTLLQNNLLNLVSKSMHALLRELKKNASLMEVGFKPKDTLQKMIAEYYRVTTQILKGPVTCSRPLYDETLLGTSIGKNWHHLSCHIRLNEEYQKIYNGFLIPQCDETQTLENVSDRDIEEQTPLFWENFMCESRYNPDPADHSKEVWVLPHVKQKTMNSLASFLNEILKKDLIARSQKTFSESDVPASETRLPLQMIQIDRFQLYRTFTIGQQNNHTLLQNLFSCDLGEFTKQTLGLFQLNQLHTLANLFETSLDPEENKK